MVAELRRFDGAHFDAELLCDWNAASLRWRPVFDFRKSFNEKGLCANGLTL
jgi:hypothetical protein